MTSEGPTFTEAAIRDLALSRSYERGESYYDRGAVRSIVRRGDQVRAEVAGSRPRPYSVTIEFDSTGIVSAECSCPYDHGGICKHRVAVLLTVLRDPESVRDQEPVDKLIDDADVDRENLVELLVELSERDPEVADWIESRLATVNDGTTEAISVDSEVVRRRANHALPRPTQRGHTDAYAEAARMADELDGLVEHARKAMDAGENDAALGILEAVTEVLATNHWANLLPHDVPELFETFDTLGETFTEAMLAVDLTDSEREAWGRRLIEWDHNLRHFTGRPTLSMAADAALEGWGDEHLQEALAGELDEGGLNGAEPEYTDDLMTSRLAVLERQGRTDEYLNLARVAGETQRYVEMLANEGRVEEAVDCAIERLSAPLSLLGVARTLHENGHSMAALRVGEHGLAVDGTHRHRVTLAEWLRDRAASLDRDELALRAAIAVFEERPSVSAFQAVESLADDEWERVRTDLLDGLREQTPTSANAAEVFHREGQYDDAIDVAERSGRTPVVEPVVDGVVEARPEWALEICKSQAEPIIENGKHDSYETAVRWLRRAGNASRAADELHERRDYVETIRDDHTQKYKLRPMLDDLLEAF